MKEEIAKREWEKHFGDEGEFLDKYFSTYYKPDNLIINTSNPDQAFIYMGLILRYNYKYYNDIIPIGYITAVLTNPEFRNKGYFRITMEKIFDKLISQDYIVSCLIPANQELTQTYIRYGYANCYVDKKNEDSNKSIIHEDKTIELYKELGYDLSLIKPNTSGMIRIINLEKAIALYAKYHPKVHKTYKVVDGQIPMNNKVIEISKGLSKVIDDSTSGEEITILELTKLIFKDSYMDKMFDQ